MNQIPTPAHRKAQNASAVAGWIIAIPGSSDGHNALMHESQSKIIELLREVDLAAVKEIERLNLKVAKLEIRTRQAAEQPIPKLVAKDSCPVIPAPIKAPSLPDAPELLNEHQVASFCN